LAWRKKELTASIHDRILSPTQKEWFSISFSFYIILISNIQITAMKTKADLHSFSPFVFTWHGAKKGSDRFYAWPDPLFPL